MIRRLMIRLLDVMQYCCCISAAIWTH